ncbi:uncharacterized protein LOC130135132 [Syzygium oleosum]|uniref:uncharacterized protein LOC130135132 n=1 Tax=Syzygium oleosum TaxID=219896 RepID=UPI0024BA34B8|nr:uncharacterized protein LOC130135132 [Syzygium oleosum]
MEELANHNADVDNANDDEAPMLSSKALVAPQEFHCKQNQSPADQPEVALVTEDWRLSQFCYDCGTAETVANEVLALCSGTRFRVACIACPRLYAYLKRIDPSVSVQLLECDKRFEQYESDFPFYDYNQPGELPTEMKHAYQVIVADPPYLVRA